MTTTDRCRIDPSRPCGACSAPGSDECPYTYLLADLFVDDHTDDHASPEDHAHPDDETDPAPAPVDHADSREHEPA